ncbi:hypothetical protein RIF29_28187 [Crotalaria pallida]|uniref:BED-type domain-containing protein n=1 Tax=Crotalaria pallida TaxID=3830 RepID=A0AAN9I1Q6_CROPI
MSKPPRAQPDTPQAGSFDDELNRIRNEPRTRSAMNRSANRESEASTTNRKLRRRPPPRGQERDATIIEHDVAEDNMAIEDVIENVDVEEEENEDVDGAKPKVKKPRATKAKCWEYFTVVEVVDEAKGYKKVKCNGCNSTYLVGGTKYGTNSMRRHIVDCSKIDSKDVGQMLMDGQAKLKSRMIDQLVSREMCASAIIEHDLPFNFAEYKKIRVWLKYLNPDWIPVSRNTVKADVLKVYMREKQRLKETLASIPNRICLTSDLWTACTTEGYICLTAHYVDSNWKLNSKILNFCHMPPPHSGLEICAMLLEFLKEWNIEKKIFSITLDNATSNDTLVTILKHKLDDKNGLVAGGEFFHVRCSAHILNLIVQDGLKVVGDALQKVRDSVKYVKGSEIRKKNFRKCIEETGGIDCSVDLKLDMPIRWNSTYILLSTALKYKRAFNNFPLYDSAYKYCPSSQEWTRAERICEFLLPFFQTTELISSTSYPTSNLYFMQVWKIQLGIMKSLNDDDGVIRDMSVKMKEKFDKYWDEYSIVLAMGAVLDPRMKLKMLRCCYLEIDVSTVDYKVHQVSSKLSMLFDLYKSSTRNTSNSNVQSVQPTSSLTPSVPTGSSISNRGMFDLISGLPEDVARDCLIRASYQQFSSVAAVCKRWQTEVQSPEFRRRRRAAGKIQKLLVAVQSRVEPEKTGTGLLVKSSTNPVYQLSVFEPETGSWSELPVPPGFDGGLPMFCQIVGVGYDVVVMGGWDPDSWKPSNSVLIYNFISGTWRCGAHMPGGPRTFFACASDSNRMVYVAGGHDEEKNALRSAFAYDVLSDIWIPLLDMARERDECKAVFRRGGNGGGDNNTLCVIGGYCTDMQGRFERSAEEFDVVAWKWGPMKEEFLDDAICPRTCVNGNNGDNDKRLYMCKGDDVVASDGSTWRSVAKVPVEVRNVACVGVWDGAVLLIGSSGIGKPHMGFVLDVKSGAWTKVVSPDNYTGHVQSGCLLEI